MQLAESLKKTFPAVSARLLALFTVIGYTCRQSVESLIWDGNVLMKRVVVITVGATHSGKTTFAKKLEQRLPNSVVIDRDNQAEFINTHYKALLPKQGANTIKNVLTRALVDYAINETVLHVIQCNANRTQRGRLDLLERFNQKGFISLLVHFEIPDGILRERIATSQRSTSIIRTRSNFAEVLDMQQTDSNASAPMPGEANHLFILRDGVEVESVIQEIVKIAQG